MMKLYTRTAGFMLLKYLEKADIILEKWRRENTKRGIRSLKRSAY